MRVLYLGANLRMRMSVPTGNTQHAFGIKLGLEQAGHQFVPLMAGDQVDTQHARKFYKKQLKRFLPQGITGALRDMYEIVLDRRFYSVVESRLQDIHPDILLPS